MSFTSNKYRLLAARADGRDEQLRVRLHDVGPRLLVAPLNPAVDHVRECHARLAAERSRRR